MATSAAVGRQYLVVTLLQKVQKQEVLLTSRHSHLSQLAVVLVPESLPSVETSNVNVGVADMSLLCCSVLIDRIRS